MTHTDHRDTTLLDRIEITCGELTGAVAQLDEFLERNARPVERHSVRLTPQVPIVTDQAGRTAPSVGIHNRGPVTVWLSPAGEIPSEAGGGIPIPGGSMVVIPIAIKDAALGIDPRDVATLPPDGINVDVYRYWTVQQQSATHRIGEITVGIPQSMSTAYEPGALGYVGTDSQQLITANPDRRFLSIANHDGPGTVFLSFGGNASLGAGLVIPAGVVWEMPTNAIFSGQINAIATEPTNVALLEL